MVLKWLSCLELGSVLLGLCLPPVAQGVECGGILVFQVFIRSID
jgi:hypothetical protein